MIVKQSNWEAVLDAVTETALKYFGSLPQRSVYRPTDPIELQAVVGSELPEGATPPEVVLADLARDLDPFVTAHSCGRFFGFVVGGLHPAAYGAELLTATWDQNAGLYAVTPGVAVVEEVALGWLLELLDLPRDASAGLVTGGQMATFTCLAAARDAVLRDFGWDVESDGLQGAPKVNVIVKSEKHATVPRALRFLGLGHTSAIEVASDYESRIDVGQLARALAGLEGPVIVCVEAGNVNTGSFDHFDAIADVVEDHREKGIPVWTHVDGAVGLWARASDSHRHHAEGLERLDSWSTDAHKLLNVAYDSGIAVCKDVSAHRAAMSVHASYLVHSERDVARDPMDWNPEFSRRARGLGVYATLKSLGRSGVGELVDRSCELARRFAAKLQATGKAEILNTVVFNQVLVRWSAEDGNHDAFNERVIDRIQHDGTAFFSGTTWNGMRLMRISVSDQATDEADVDRSIDALMRAASAG
jgi:glutamate/tyrosine decarboxylase-like PLP-dependent enzyme